jgi:hypothetical protein
MYPNITNPITAIPPPNPQGKKVLSEFIEWTAPQKSDFFELDFGHLRGKEGEG